VQESVALQADVDERRLHAGKHVVHRPLVDVADDRALASALDVELADLPGVAAARLLSPAPALAGRTALGL
jgi:hypothetical protein